MVGKLSFFVGLALGAYVWFRVIPDVRKHRELRKMPPDNLGNYDLDGVSYDPEAHEVVVAADARTTDPEIVVVEEIVTLHAPDEPRERNNVSA